MYKLVNVAIITNAFWNNYVYRMQSKFENMW